MRYALEDATGGGAVQEGEGVTWRQSTTRRVKMSDLGKHWAQKAGGCAQCQGKDLEDPCYGKCISTALDTPTLIGLTNSALKDFTNFPNYGIRVLLPREVE